MYIWSITDIEHSLFINIISQSIFLFFLLLLLLLSLSLHLPPPLSLALSLPLSLSLSIYIHIYIYIYKFKRWRERDVAQNLWVCASNQISSFINCFSKSKKKRKYIIYKIKLLKISNLIKYYIISERTYHAQIKSKFLNVSFYFENTRN